MLTDIDQQLLHISIHALHEESDRSGHWRWSVYGEISIHALHEESDLFHHCRLRYGHRNFNPRSP